MKDKIHIGNCTKEKMVELICIGNCTNQTIVELIFGTVSEFARQVELNGDRFVHDNYITVTYDEFEDIHFFWKSKS